MTRHRDINKAHAELFGEGWHIEYHSESIISHRKGMRRSREKCIYYNKGYCNHALISCVGVDCSCY